MTVVEYVDDWRAAVEAAVAHGERFAAAWASGGVWRAAFGDRVISCPADRAETIVDLVGAAEWDEREAHDLYGLQFAGHTPLRPLIKHPESGWTTPVSGDGVHEVAVGPIHAGVIESGHFRFHTVGDRVLVMDPRLFYKHRGLERAAEGRTVEEGLAFARRACAACAVANTVAYAHAVEDALGLWPDRDLRVARTLALELERLYNHLHDIGALCAGVGFAPGTMAFAALKERAQRVNAELTGHRFLFGAVAVGRGELALDAATTGRARTELRELRADAAAAWRSLEFAASMQARLDGVGPLERADAERLGTVGPAARASGVRHDVREHSPRLWYGGFVPAGPREPTGDVAARLQVRAAEIESTCDLLDEILTGPVRPGATERRNGTSTLGLGRVESPRGATTCAVELATERIARLHLRTASYANWPSVARAAAGCLLPDFPLINKSFELCYACVDR
ncbi:MAG TPA: NADH-quinone oxidoreductase subunit C [Solirubrobacter sp.]|nr:NADH-quinone oxidoreductase subunit C [Solirubrobacter sp.]